MKYCSILGPPGGFRGQLSKKWLGLDSQQLFFDRWPKIVPGSRTPAGVRTAPPPAAGPLGEKTKKSMKIEAAFRRPPETDFLASRCDSGRFQGQHGSKMDPKWGPKWLQKGSPTGYLILNSFFNQFSLIFELFFE